MTCKKTTKCQNW